MLLVQENGTKSGKAVRRRKTEQSQAKRFEEGKRNKVRQGGSKKEKYVRWSVMKVLGKDSCRDDGRRSALCIHSYCLHEAQGLFI